MPECPVTLEGPLDFGPGVGTLWRITPVPLPVGCTCKIFVDDRETTRTGDYGPFHVTGWSATHIIIEPPPATDPHLRVEVRCPDCASTFNPSFTPPPKLPGLGVVEKIAGVVFGVPAFGGIFIFVFGYWLFLGPFTLFLWPWGFTPSKWWDEGIKLWKKFWKELKGFFKALWN